jgi:hypothetical protein
MIRVTLFTALSMLCIAMWGCGQSGARVYEAQRSEQQGNGGTTALQANDDSIDPIALSDSAPDGDQVVPPSELASRIQKYFDAQCRIRLGKEIPDALSLAKVGDFKTLKEVTWADFGGGFEVASHVDVWLYVDGNAVRYYSVVAPDDWGTIKDADRSRAVQAAMSVVEGDHFILRDSRPLDVAIVVPNEDPLITLVGVVNELKGPCQFALYQGTLEHR